jgi:hypothetical protein
MKGHDDDITLIKEFLRQYDSSMKSWNLHRGQGKIPLHVVITFKNIEDRLTKDQGLQME